MAVRTAAHPNGFGPPPTSPLIAQGRDTAGHWIRITLPYDNATKALQSGIVTHKDAGCSANNFVVGTTAIPVPDGDGTLDVLDLPVLTVTELEAVGYTFE